MTQNELLNKVLANGLVFGQKLRHYHWNVRGTDFFTLHEKFGELYGAFNEWTDGTAERIIALGGQPVATLAQAQQWSAIQEDESVPDAGEMVGRILADFDTQSAAIGEAIAFAEEAGDRTTANLLDDVADGIAGHRWMLKAYLKA